MALSWFSTIAACIAVWATPKAEACSFPPPGTVFSRTVFPSDGAADVPTNAKLVVVYQVMGSALTDHFRLQASDGAEVDLQVSKPEQQSSASSLRQTFVLTPAEPLRPHVQYRLLSTINQAPCTVNDALSTAGGAYPACSPAAGARDGGIQTGLDAGTAAFVAASFMTGAGPDEVRPALNGALTYKSYPYTCTNGACCGPYQGYTVGFNWPSATDNTAGIMYELSHAGSLVLFPVGEGARQVSLGRVEGAFLCSGTVFPISMMDGYTVFLGQPGAYQVVAVDLAGNRSDPISVEVELGCQALDGGVPDGGPDRAPDGAPDRAADPSGADGASNANDGGQPTSFDGTGGVASSGGASGPMAGGGGGASGFGGSRGVGSSTDTTNPGRSSGCSFTVSPPQTGATMLGLFLLLSTAILWRGRSRTGRR